MTAASAPIQNLPASLKPPWQRLQTVLSHYVRPALAFSGGVDSSFLAWFLVHIVRKPVMGFTVLSPLHSARDREETRRMARIIGLPLEEMALDVLNLPPVRQNAPDRCYHCKRAVMGRIGEAAAARGCGDVLDGSQADDAAQVRPGRRALQELGVLSPLALAGFRKEDIRDAGRLVSLTGWERPSQSCLATRIPYNTPITTSLLARIEQAEAFLDEAGWKGVRVRVHGDLARIEGPPGIWSALDSVVTREKIVGQLRLLGFEHVTLDLAGYRSGCWDKPAGTPAGTMEDTP